MPRYRRSAQRQDQPTPGCWLYLLAVEGTNLSPERGVKWWLLYSCPSGEQVVFVVEVYDWYWPWLPWQRVPRF